MAAQSILCTPASAQSAPPVAERNGSGEPEIVVTAQKREQAIIDVPLSITAVSAEQITRRGATAIEDLQYSVPGMSISQFAPGQQRIQLRGISVYGGLPTVGVYMDEMPLNNEINQTGQDLRLLDVQRIEVLRGPQGTLYGQGAMGGTIRYITNPVDFKDVQAAADGEVADVKGGKP
ncbi:MAG TPA: TonB-dependent receptor plug domain-containing protein, partial [Sphingobium sp.]|nr:TonB-dependent receptor plug domain-containing protein [Sphingobium sp.]